MKNSLRQSFQLFVNRVLLFFPIRTSEGKPLFVLPARSRKVVRIARYGITIISLLSALLTFGNVLIAFGIGLGFYLLTAFLEHILFFYFTLYVHPRANFEINQEKWVAVAFGYASPRNRAEIRIPVVSWVFDDEQYAKNIYNLIRAWMGKALDDKERAIVMRVVLHKNRQYTFFCYPSENRPSSRKFYQEIEEEMRESKKTRDDLHYKLTVKLTLGKLFDMLPTSMLPTFRSIYTHGQQYIFRVTFQNPDKTMREISDLTDLVLYDLKILEENELTRKDQEYDLIRYFRHAKKQNESKKSHA